MNISELDVKAKPNRSRVGRGPGSGNGKTCGRGQNGQRSRSGFKFRAWFEGGQMPLQRRVPKRGFKSFNRVEYQIVNVSGLESRFDDGASVTIDDLIQHGLIRNNKTPVKILGTGVLNKKLTVQANKFTKSAAEKITQAGGQIEPKPFKQPNSTAE